MKQMYRWSSVGPHCWKMEFELCSASGLIEFVPQEPKVQTVTSLFGIINQNVQRHAVNALQVLAFSGHSF